MDGWVVNQIFVLDMCVRRVPYYYSPSPLSPPSTPPFFTNDWKHKDNLQQITIPQSPFSPETPQQKKTSAQLGTTTQVPNWEQQPKFPIGNNNPSSQLGTTT
jgi:hypothetical protein